MNNRVLVVDDDIAMTDMVTRALSARFDVHTENTLEDAWAHLAHHPADVVLTDLMLDDGTGLDLARRLREDGRRTPVILMTAFGNLDNAVEAMRGGVYDFLTKPLDIERLEIAVDRAAKHHALVGEVEMLRRAVEGRRLARWMVGESEVMRELADMVERVANTDVTVLVTGESGTGKELVAQALHDLSDRRQGPFIPINCAAMPATLLESELFGHARGAFTGARESREGLFVAANGGTLFLDEIGEMAPEVQAKLLRALQEREVRPVGGNTSVPFDARIVTATNQEIEQRVREGRFREDLFYRINVVNLAVPPLRDRGNDILLLAQHFVEETAQRLRREVWGFSKAVAGRLLSHDWPGNVRELQNTVERAVALARFERLGVSDLPPKLQRARTTASAFQIEDPDFMPALADLEKRYILHVLDRCDGNRTRASEVLGIDRKTLYRKLERWSEEEEEEG